MSRPQDLQRGFLPFGNPFKILSPKSSTLSSRPVSLLNNFEVNLANGIRELAPTDTKDILTLSWMRRAIDSLCETHNDIKTLIAELELPVSDWEEQWVDVYLDISIKLLDLCNAFSSELTRLHQGNLFLQLSLHHLESTSPRNLSKARSSLDSWRNHIGSKNHRIENCTAILGSLVQSLSLPKVKNSAKGMVLMRALYGVKVKTLYISSVFAAAFSRSSKNLLFLTVSDDLPWAGAFAKMQNTINGEIKSFFLLSDEATVLKELDAADASIQKLYPLIQDCENAGLLTESMMIHITELRTKGEKLSEGLDLLSKRVDCFFKIILSGRNALLGNLRLTGPATTAGKKPEERIFLR